MSNFNPYIAWPARVLLGAIFSPFILAALVIFGYWFIVRIIGCWAFENAFCGRVTIKQVMKESGY